jgi:hypothetical protein
MKYEMYLLLFFLMKERVEMIIATLKKATNQWPSETPNPYLRINTRSYVNIIKIMKRNSMIKLLFAIFLILFFISSTYLTSINLQGIFIKFTKTILSFIKFYTKMSKIARIITLRVTFSTVFQLFFFLYLLILLY